MNRFNVKKMGRLSLTYILTLALFVGCSGKTVPKSRGPEFAPPNPPSELKTSASFTLTGPVISVSWDDNSDNEDGFRVEARSKEDSAYKTIAELPKDTKNFTDNITPFDKTIYYRITAFNPNGESATARESLKLGLFSSLERKDISDFTVVGNTLFLSWSDGLSTIDISDPKDPKLNKTIPLKGYVKNGHLAVRGGILFATDADKLFCFDISDPLNPKTLSDLSIGADSLDIEPYHDFLYILGSTSTFFAVEIRNGRNLKIAKSIRIDGIPRNMVVKGNYLLVANGREGILVFDLKNPAHPKLAATFSQKPPRFYNAAAVWGDKLIASVRDFENEIDILEASDPLKMVLLGKSLLDWIPLEVSISKNIFFVPESEAGLEMVWGGDPKNIKIAGTIESEIDKVKSFEGIILAGHQSKLYILTTP